MVSACVMDDSFGHIGFHRRIVAGKRSVPWRPPYVSSNATDTGNFDKAGTGRQRRIGVELTGHAGRGVPVVDHGDSDQIPTASHEAGEVGEKRVHGDFGRHAVVRWKAYPSWTINSLIGRHMPDGHVPARSPAE